MHTLNYSFKIHEEKPKRTTWRNRQLYNYSRAFNTLLSMIARTSRQKTRKNLNKRQEARSLPTRPNLSLENCYMTIAELTIYSGELRTFAKG